MMTLHSLIHMYKKDKEKSSWMIDGAVKLTMSIEQPSCRADLVRFLAWCGTSFL